MVVVEGLTKQYTYPVIGDGETPVDPDSAPVTVYVQNSQTGALLANARVAIHAAAGDPPTLVEVVNQTLPAGVGTFTLQKTGPANPYPRYYRAYATAPGYSQIVENHSFLLTGPYDVIIEMRPDSGGPTNPENTFLDFYVRDIYGNPIPSATIQCGAPIRQTNANGYAVFEVSKNSTHYYTVSKSKFVTIEGPVTVGDDPRNTINIVLGATSLPTYTPTPGPGATPTPDHRTNEQKGQAVIDMLANHAELIAALAILAAVMGLMQFIMPGRRRR